jgi:hypothetical protein
MLTGMLVMSSVLAYEHDLARAMADQGCHEEVAADAGL